MGFPAFCNPFVYMKLYGFHAAWKGLIKGFMGFLGRVGDVRVWVCVGGVAVNVWRVLFLEVE